jgi:hypothetical protein
MSALNLCLWAIGLALQVLLVAVLFLRGLVRRFPVFAFLIVFYIVRSVLLFALFGLVQQNTYSQLYDFLFLADFCLQILLAAEIAVCILRLQGGWSLRRVATAAAFVILGVAIAGGSAALLPARGRVPIDRGAAFASALMVLLVVWMVFARMSGSPRRIAEGFAVYGVTGILAGIERNYAALHRYPGAYAASSYAQAGVYMVVVLYWLLTLRAGPAAGKSGSRV